MRFRCQLGPYAGSYRILDRETGLVATTTPNDPDYPSPFDRYHETLYHLTTYLATLPDFVIVRSYVWFPLRGSAVRFH